MTNYARVEVTETKRSIIRTYYDAEGFIIQRISVPKDLTVRVSNSTANE